MAKDPAALLYIDKYLIATSEMDADCVGWYTKLILHQYDKGSLPNDLEKLASLCNVRFSEFERFKQVFNQVLNQKFKQNESGRLEQDFASEIIKKRETFKNKRSNAGKWGYAIKFIKKHFSLKKAEIEFLKENLNLNEFDLKNEQVFKQMVKQTMKLFINVDEDKDINKSKNVNKDKKENTKVIFPFDTENFRTQWQLWKTFKNKEHGFKFKSSISEQASLKKLGELSDNNEKTAIAIIHQSIGNGWKGLFELKQSNNGKHSKKTVQYSDDFKQEIFEKLQSE